MFVRSAFVTASAELRYFKHCNISPRRSVFGLGLRKRAAADIVATVIATLSRRAWEDSKTAKTPRLNNNG